MQIKLEKKFYDNLASNWSCWLDPNELFLIPYEKESTRFISLVKTKERHYDLGLSFSDIYKKVQAEFNLSESLVCASGILIIGLQDSEGNCYFISWNRQKRKKTKVEKYITVQISMFNPTQLLNAFGDCSKYQLRLYQGPKGLVQEYYGRS